MNPIFIININFQREYIDMKRDFEEEDFGLDSSEGRTVAVTFRVCFI
jgi:hypothetical protein